MKVHTKIWLEDDRGRLLVGEGRLKIFHAIARTGSMSAAARELGMSYRAVWGKVRTTEERLGLRLVEGTAGGPKHGGATLTAQAWEFLKCFETLSEAVAEEVDRLTDEILPERFPTDD